jgi:hypothetical protein
VKETALEAVPYRVATVTLAEQGTAAGLPSVVLSQTALSAVSLATGMSAHLPLYWYFSSTTSTLSAEGFTPSQTCVALMGLTRG